MATIAVERPLRRQYAEDPGELTPREDQVLGLVGLMLTNREIGDRKRRFDLVARPEVSRRRGTPGVQAFSKDVAPTD